MEVNLGQRSAIEGDVSFSFVCQLSACKDSVICALHFDRISRWPWATVSKLEVLLSWSAHFHSHIAFQCTGAVKWAECNLPFQWLETAWWDQTVWWKGWFISFPHLDSELGIWTSVQILCTERLLPACIAVIQAKRAWVSSSNHRHSLCFFFPFHRRSAIVTSVAKDVTTPHTPTPTDIERSKAPGCISFPLQQRQPSVGGCALWSANMRGLFLR